MGDFSQETSLFNISEILTVETFLCIACLLTTLIYVQNAELERRIALDSVQKEMEEEETAAEADQARGHSDVR